LKVTKGLLKDSSPLAELVEENSKAITKWRAKGAIAMKGATFGDQRITGRK